MVGCEDGTLVGLPEGFGVSLTVGLEVGCTEGFLDG